MLQCKWRRARVICLWAGALGLTTWQLSAASPAHAYEDQFTVGVALGYAHATQHNLPHPGGLVGIEASLGLGNAWSLRANASYSLHPGHRALSNALLDAELIYLVDVLEFVPYFGLGIDGLGSWTSRDTPFRVDFGVHPALGIDWLLSRELSLGLCARPVFVLSAWSSRPLYASISANLTWLFEL